MTPILVRLQQKVSDFCFARKTEKEDLMKQVQQNIVSDTTTTAVTKGIIPPRPPPPSASITTTSAGSFSAQAQQQWNQIYQQGFLALFLCII